MIESAPGDLVVTAGSILILAIVCVILLGGVIVGVGTLIHKTKTRQNGKDIRTIQEYKEEKHY